MVDAPKSTSSSSSKKSDKDVDLTNTCRGVWLVKVPKYISDRWNTMLDEADDGQALDVGLLSITRRSKMKPNVSFSLAESVASTGANSNGDRREIPTEHKFVISSASAQTMAVLSATAPKGASKVDISSKSNPRPVLAVEGRIVQRAECRPQSTTDVYMSLKKNAILKAIEPTRQTIQLDKAVLAYKPKANHEINIAHAKMKKEAGKMLRDDRPVVMNRLFALFERHQYYNIKDLVSQTRQPITYLKEILSDVCNYNVKAPHRNMWELKPEYRHYKSAGAKQDVAKKGAASNGGPLDHNDDDDDDDDDEDDMIEA